MTTPKKKMVFTSVNQILNLIKSTPALQQLPRFATFKNVELSTTPVKSCNCSRNIITPDVNKQMLESTLSSLTSADFLTIKGVLGLDELCYYKRTQGSGKLEMICV
jgi:hypothetical protein